MIRAKNLLAGGLCYSGLNWIYSFISRVKKRAVVLGYHRVIGGDDGLVDKTQAYVTAQEFNWQIKHLLKTHQPISLLDLINQRRWNEPVFAVTFDDGYFDNYSKALPIMEKLGLTATVFVATDAVSGRDLLWWDKLVFILSKSFGSTLTVKGQEYSVATKADIDQLQGVLTAILKRDPKRDEILKSLVAQFDINAEEEPRVYLNWDEVKALKKRGWTIGAHTINHPVLTSVAREEAQRQILESTQEIAAHIGENPRLFAYPNGKRKDTNDEIIRFLTDKGFVGAVLMDEHFPFTFSNPYLVNRIAPRGSESKNVYKIRLSNLYYRFN